MMYGFAPPPYPSIDVLAFKANGVSSLGTAAIGPLIYRDANSQNKTNTLNLLFGDVCWAPTYAMVISDPDFVDAPLTHIGFY